MASGVVAGGAQAIEVYLKRVADEADRIHRLQEFEALYSLTHPFGDLRIHINVTYPIAAGLGGLDGPWLSRMRNSTSKSYAVLNGASDPLRPGTGDAQEFRLLVEPQFDLVFNRVATQAGGDGVHLLDHGAALMLRTTSSQSSIYVHFDERKIDVQIEAPTVKLIDDASVSSWRDLYDSELIITLPEQLPLVHVSRGAPLLSQVAPSLDPDC